MATKHLLELKKVLEEEREALLRGAMEEVCRAASYKAQLVEKIKEEGVSKKDQALLEEILKLNQRNQALIKAALSFIEEAFQELAKAMSAEVFYRPPGQKASSMRAQILSVEA